jgi:hypothetical protein
MRRSQALEELRRALVAHQGWKDHLRELLYTGSTDIPPEQLAADDRCELGIWLNGPTATELGDPARCATLRTLHAHFHESAARALSLARQGDSPGVLATIAYGGELSTASERLIRELVTWHADIAARAGSGE